jgi:glycosyltransferase involved in cell wall biosynthesis
MTETKVLFLTLHTFSLTGGIEKVCRCLGKALSDLTMGSKDFSSKLFSMHDNPTDVDTRYIAEKAYKGFNGNAIGFGISAILSGLRSHQVILSHVNLLLFAKLIKFLSPKTKIILLAHGIEIWRPIPNWKKKFLQRSVEIWAVSNFTLTQLVEMHHIASEKIKVLNNCLDPYFDFPNDFEKPAKLLKRYDLNKVQPILFTLTRLSSQESYKGYDRVLLAMQNLLHKFPDLHYVIAGKADENERLRVLALVDKLKLNDHVTLAGFINDDELTDYFKLGNVFIMPSTLEGFGIVFIEAAAVGTKIIGGRVDGTVDALLNGKLGTLINPSDTDEIAQSIEKNLNSEANPKLIQELCVANFGYEQYVMKVKALIS